LISLDSISDAVVIGLPDSEWGQIVAAILVVDEAKNDASSPKWDINRVRGEMRKLVAPWKMPKKVLVRKDLPRNGMGKVQKKNLVSLFDE